ncbi:zinc metalloprotease HtpX [Streptomyces tanashiensis]
MFLANFAALIPIGRADDDDAGPAILGYPPAGTSSPFAASVIHAT